jgi:ABC-2 type transport system permease protein
VLAHLFLANLKMFYRNRQAAFWAFAFPLIFVAVFGLFRFDDPPNIEMVIVDRSNDEISRRVVEGIRQAGFMDITFAEDSTAAAAAVSEGEVGYALLIPSDLAEKIGVRGDPTSLVLIIGDQRAQANGIVRSVVRDTLDQTSMAVQGTHPLLSLTAEGVSARQLNYFDFTLPGLVGMGVMFYGVIGIASVMALYRQQRVLKRIKATPMKVRTFFAAQVAAYLVIAMLQTIVILLVGVLAFGANIYGNVLWAVPLILLANLAFLNLGFIVGAFSKTVQAASGLGNVVVMPMMFFSGVFFPTDSLPPVMGPLVQFLPLTPLVDALRGVMLDSKALWDFPTEIAVLSAWVAATAGLAIRTFRFD